MFQHILAPLDGSSTAECVLPHLAALARAYDSRVTLLQVLESSTKHDQKAFADPWDWELRKVEAKAYLNEIACRLDNEIGINAEPVVTEGYPAECIIEYAAEHDANLILVSSHGHAGLSRWNVSSVVRKIIQQSRRSTMLVRAYRSLTPDFSELYYQRVFVPLDGSRRAECVLPFASTLARIHNAELLVGYVVVRPHIAHQTSLSKRDQLLLDRLLERCLQSANDYFERLQSQVSCPFEPCILVSTDAALSLHELVEQQQVDLVILSAHGYSGKSRWPYGSITTSFIEYGGTPLLIVQDMEPQDLESTEAEIVVRESEIPCLRPLENVAHEEYRSHNLLSDQKKAGDSVR